MLCALGYALCPGWGCAPPADPHGEPPQAASTGFEAVTEAVVIEATVSTQARLRAPPPPPPRRLPLRGERQPDASRSQDWTGAAVTRSMRFVPPVSLEQFSAV